MTLPRSDHATKLERAIADAEWLLEIGADSRQVLAVLYGVVPKKPVAIVDPT